jgi:hypothetical protein
VLKIVEIFGSRFENHFKEMQSKEAKNKGHTAPTKTTCICMSCHRAYMNIKILGENK